MFDLCNRMSFQIPNEMLLTLNAQYRYIYYETNVGKPALFLNGLFKYPGLHIIDGIIL